MASKPTTYPDFCTDNPSNMAQLPASLVASGWLPGQPIPAQYLSKLAHNVGEWIRFLGDSQTATAFAGALEPSIRLIGGGAWSYSLTSTALSWSANAYISYPGLPDAANTVAPGSVTLPSGSVAYVVSNAPFATTGTTTSGSSSLTDVGNADQITVGWAVQGAGIPSGATVASVDAANKTVVISSAATASASDVSLSFAGSGSLAVQVAPIASYAATANSVVIARATDTHVIVGVGSGQMNVRDTESRRLLGADGFTATLSGLASVALPSRSAVALAVPADTALTAGSLTLCQAGATTAGTYRHQFAGFVLQAAAAGANTMVVSSGLLGGFTGLSVGAVYYLDPANSGGITTTKPTAAGQWVVPVGVASSATQMLVNGYASAAAVQNSVRNRLLVDMGSYTTNTSYQNGTVFTLGKPAYVNSAYQQVTPYFTPDYDCSLLQLTVDANLSTSPEVGLMLYQTAGTSSGYTSGYIANTSDKGGKALTANSNSWRATFVAGQVPLYASCSYYMASFSSVPTALITYRGRMTIDTPA